MPGLGPWQHLGGPFNVVVSPRVTSGTTCLGRDACPAFSGCQIGGLEYHLYVLFPVLLFKTCFFGRLRQGQKEKQIFDLLDDPHSDQGWARPGAPATCPRQVQKPKHLSHLPLSQVDRKWSSHVSTVFIRMLVLQTAA